MRFRTPNAAELFVWTDIESEHEEDFNRWYDREHMAERVSVPGFQWARRYRAVSSSVRRYLALYRTDDISVFNSASYRKAFENQTAWSNTNFGRMNNTKRRVMTVPFESGFGCGSALGMVILNEPEIDIKKLKSILLDVEKQDGVQRIHCLQPDPALSTPLPSEDPEYRRLESAVVVDTTAEPIAAATIRALIEELGLETNRGITLRLMWGLDSSDLEVSTDSIAAE